MLKDLLARADVLVQNLAPGAAERTWAWATSAARAEPRLIACDISGYGNDGPYRDKKAYDLLIQKQAGFLSVTGTPDEPSKAGISIADIAAGMYAYSSILAALMQRQKTGEGSHVDISMLEALGEWMGFPMYYAYEGAEPPPRSEAAHATIYPYGPFEAGDGKTIVLGLQNEREWKVFCDKVLLQPALLPTRASTATAGATPTGRRSRPSSGIFGRLDAEQVIARLEDAQIANAHVNAVGDLWSHPQLQSRGRLAQVDSPAAPCPPCCHPACTAVSTTAWTPFPRWANTRRRSCASWVATTRPSRGCGCRGHLTAGQAGLEKGLAECCYNLRLRGVASSSWIEYLATNQGVVGSNPATRANNSESRSRGCVHRAQPLSVRRTTVSYVGVLCDLRRAEPVQSHNASKGFGRNGWICGCSWSKTSGIRTLMGELFSAIGGLQLVGGAATEAEAKLWLSDNPGGWDLIVDLILDEGSGIEVHARRSGALRRHRSSSSAASPRPASARIACRWAPMRCSTRWTRQPSCPGWTRKCSGWPGAVPHPEPGAVSAQSYRA